MTELDSTPLTASDRSPDLVVIEPTRGLLDIGARDLWHYRELLYFLVWRDVKIRYKQTALGAVWTVLQPLLTVLVFTIVFSRIAGIAVEGVPYPVFSLAGLLPWTFFSQGLTSSSNSLVGSSHLITKVYFPRILIPTAAVLAGLLDLAIALVALFVVMLVYGLPLVSGFLLLPLVLVLAFCVTFGVGIWLSSLNVRYRDVRYLVPFSVQLWLFLSPVIYPAADITRALVARGLPGWLYGLNPMVGVIEGFRWCVYGSGPPPTALILTSSVVAVLVMTSGVIFFRKVERSFADVV